jgi:hypothetical protein
MKWGPPSENEEVVGSKDMVYFGGFTQHTILGLAGSMGHFISRKKAQHLKWVFHTLLLAQFLDTLLPQSLSDPTIH